MNLLSGKVIMVTGSTRGIGRQIAITFAEHGANLVLNGRDEETLLALSSEITDRYAIEVLPLAYDVTDSAGVKQAFHTARATFGHLDGLVNNAGVLRDRLLGMIDDRNMEETLQTNVFAMIVHMQYAIRLMLRAKAGSIVNVSSIIGTHGNHGQVVYGASKAAVIGATKSAAKELASHNIRVNSIAPGFIDTDMARSIPAEKFKERISSIKMGRIGTPLDVANVALFLCSDLSGYVTGQVIGVDGGMVI